MNQPLSQSCPHLLSVSLFNGFHQMVEQPRVVLSLRDDLPPFFFTLKFGNLGWRRRQEFPFFVLDVPADSNPGIFR